MSVFNISMPLAIGSDHAGFNYKAELITWLSQKGWQIKDCGAFGTDSVDYPDFAHPVASSVEKEESAVGILICGSGNGVCMTANKHAGIRAGLCWTPEIAQLIRKHNNANVLCLPARFVSLDEAKKMVDVFLETAFEAGRHQTRINKMTC